MNAEAPRRFPMVPAQVPNGQSLDRLSLAEPRRLVTVTDKLLPRWTITAVPLTP